MPTRCFRLCSGSSTREMVLALVALSCLWLGGWVLLSPTQVLPTTNAQESCVDPTEAIAVADYSTRECGVDRIVLVVVDALRPDFIFPELKRYAKEHEVSSCSSGEESRLGAVRKSSALPAVYSGATLSYIAEALACNDSDPLVAACRAVGAFLVADAPTTTSQRVKALMTGSIPGFLEAGGNFASTAVVEDSLLRHLRGSAVVLGDATWTELFPQSEGFWQQASVFPSFNVSDLSSNDEAVAALLEQVLAPRIPRALQSEAKKSAATPRFIVAHLLGVDHSGHSFDAAHAKLHERLAFVNILLRNISRWMSSAAEEEPKEEEEEDEEQEQQETNEESSMDRPGMLIVLGDHGMTGTGDHGGDSPLETDTFLFAEVFPSGRRRQRNHGEARSAHRCSDLTRSSCSHEASKKKIDNLLRFLPCCGALPVATAARVTVSHQVDVAASLATLLGLPVPFSSTGALIPHLVTLACRRPAAATLPEEAEGGNVFCTSDDISIGRARDGSDPVEGDDSVSDQCAFLDAALRRNLCQLKARFPEVNYGENFDVDCSTCSSTLNSTSVMEERLRLMSHAVRMSRMDHPNGRLLALIGSVVAMVCSMLLYCPSNALGSLIHGTYGNGQRLRLVIFFVVVRMGGLFSTSLISQEHVCVFALLQLLNLSRLARLPSVTSENCSGNANRQGGQKRQASAAALSVLLVGIALRIARDLYVRDRQHGTHLLELPLWTGLLPENMPLVCLGILLAGALTAAQVLASARHLFPGLTMEDFCMVLTSVLPRRGSSGSAPFGRWIAPLSTRRLLLLLVTYFAAVAAIRFLLWMDLRNPFVHAPLFGAVFMTAAVAQLRNYKAMKRRAVVSQRVSEVLFFDWLCVLCHTDFASWLVLVVLFVVVSRIINQTAEQEGMGGMIADVNAHDCIETSRLVAVQSACYAAFFAQGHHAQFSTVDWHAGFVGIPAELFQTSLIPSAVLVLSRTLSPFLLTLWLMRGLAHVKPPAAAAHEKSKSPMFRCYVALQVSSAAVMLLVAAVLKLHLHFVALVAPRLLLELLLSTATVLTFLF